MQRLLAQLSQGSWLTSMKHFRCERLQQLRSESSRRMKPVWFPIPVIKQSNLDRMPAHRASGAGQNGACLPVKAQAQLLCSNRVASIGRAQCARPPTLKGLASAAQHAASAMHLISVGDLELKHGLYERRGLHGLTQDPRACVPYPISHPHQVMEGAWTVETQKLAFREGHKFFEPIDACIPCSSF